MLSWMMFSRVPPHAPPHTPPLEPPMRIQEQTREHEAQIDALTRAAFGGDGEAELVARLHADGLVRLSLVALDEAGQVVGHALFTALAVQVDGRRIDALCLAPVSVLPSWQRRGVGARLIRSGLARLAEAGFEAVVVLGHADYYPRFGFDPALASKLAAPFSGECFMALELSPGALAGERGSVTYPPAFGL